MWQGSRRVVCGWLWLILVGGAVGLGQNQDLDRSVVDDRRVPTGQLLTPAGESLMVAGRPNDLCVDTNRNWLLVKSHKNLQVVDRNTFRLIQELPIPGGASLCGLVLLPDGRILVSNAGNQIVVFGPNATADADPEQPLRQTGTWSLPEASFPCGMCLGPEPGQLAVCLSRKNQVAVLELATGTIRETWDVGIAPYQVVATEGKLWVSNLGGRRSQGDELTANSAGTATPVDDRGIANTGSVTQIDRQQREPVSHLSVPLHPTALQMLDYESLLVANTNDDSLTVIHNGRNVGQVVAKPLSDLPFGSMPNAICLGPDRERVLVALAGNNAVGVYPVDQRWAEASVTMSGMIPTAWYPSALVCDDRYLYVANLKGVGTRAKVRPAAEGRNSHDHLGLIQRISLESLTGKSLQKMTAQVRRQAALLPTRIAQRTADSQMSPVPVPERLGDPSVFQHVIYVIKENRTYDQVFGDFAQGRGDPALCTFPQAITPNHHALAERFGLLDNYYCNGVLSADGHSWATEGNVTPYLERAFGGFARSYTFGDDPLTYSSSGFLWDHVLAAGLSFRNFGEMDYAKPPAGMGYQEIWNAFQAGDAIEFQQNIGIERLRRYSSRNYPGWNMAIPDVLRIERFLEEFRQMEKDRSLPNLCIVYLPQDHLGGGVTSAAHMADNDHALGKLVEAVSGSDYWNRTLIIVNEDDPQNGFDHIDGHRSICLVISAYSKPGVHHQFYNQTSVLRTILHVLGLPPMNQNDARSPLMTDCFHATRDDTPYRLRPTEIPLNQRPAPPEQQSDAERRWRSILETVPIQRTGMKTVRDEDHLNRFIWHEMKGWETDYPVRFAGSHGLGLPELGLSRDPDSGQDD